MELGAGFVVALDMAYRELRTALPCHQHPLEEASLACGSCGVNLCDACRISIASRVVCRACASTATRTSWRRRLATLTAATALSLVLVAAALVSTARMSLVTGDPEIAASLRGPVSHEGPLAITHVAACVENGDGAFAKCNLGAMQVVECCPADLEGQCGPDVVACSSWGAQLLE